MIRCGFQTKLASYIHLWMEQYSHGWLGILVTGKFARCMLPQLFAYAINFPIQKFLQAQGKVMATAWVSAVALAFHLLP